MEAAKLPGAPFWLDSIAGTILTKGGDRETARREAHTLNGVAGNLGASTLREAARSVEGLIAGGEDCEAELQLLEEVLASLVDAIPAPDSTVEGEPAEVALDAVLPQLDRLESATATAFDDLLDGGTRSHQHVTVTDVLAQVAGDHAPQFGITGDVAASRPGHAAAVLNQRYELAAAFDGPEPPAR